MIRKSSQTNTDLIFFLLEVYFLNYLILLPGNNEMIMGRINKDKQFLGLDLKCQLFKG